MPKYKVSEEHKARPIPISLKPKHIEMLKELERFMHKNRSRVIQILIQNAYEETII